MRALEFPPAPYGQTVTTMIDSIKHEARRRA